MKQRWVTLIDAFATQCYEDQLKYWLRKNFIKYYATVQCHFHFPHYHGHEHQTFCEQVLHGGPYTGGGDEYKKA